MNSTENADGVLTSSTNDNSSIEKQGDVFETVPAVDCELEKRTKWKTDLLILPLLTSVNFLATMSRSDLANAQTAGMEKDLGLTASVFSTVATFFLIGYIVCQLPATLLMRRIGPNRQFSGAMMVWGILTVCSMKATNSATLMGFRALIGAAESFIEGTILYLSFWYPYNELGFRGAIVYSATALSGSFNGLVAFGIQNSLDGVNGWAAWQWIFFIEGLISVVWSFVIFFLLPPTPEQARFFKPREKTLVIERSRRADNTGERKIRPKLILKVLVDPQFWLVSLLGGCAHFCSSGIGNFVPAIIHGLGYSSISAQLMTVLVYGITFVAIIGAARISDKIGKRSIVIIVCASYTALGYVLLLVLTNDIGRIIGTCLVAGGSYPIVLLGLAWTATNNVGYTYRASASGIVMIIGQLLAVASNFSYTDPPYYQKGLAASLGMISASAVLAGILWLYLRSLNKEKIKNQWKAETCESRSLTVDDLGNRHPDFFFAL